MGAGAGAGGGRLALDDAAVAAPGGVRLESRLSTGRRKPPRMVDPRALAAILDGADLSRFDVLLMPDFALDHMIRWPTLDEALRVIREAGASGNGNARAARQVLRPGGGATNVAHALARLGLSTHLIAVTSPVGLSYLERTLGRDGVDLALVRDDGHLSITGAIECEDASVMIHTPAPAEGLAPESLRDADWDRIAASDAVFVGDWSNPRAHDLMSETWRVAKQAGARTYADPGMPGDDAASRRARLETLSLPQLDALSLNDEEVLAYAESRAEPTEDALVDAARGLSRRVRARVDLHSQRLTASFLRGDLLGTAPRFDVDLRQATGAGDTWTSGLIVGDLLGLDPDERLLLSNALVALYISSERVEPPTKEDLLRFLRKAPPLLA